MKHDGRVVVLHTPWGRATKLEQPAPGLSRVETETGGGWMLSEPFARRHLSEFARERGRRYGRYYCYEHEHEWCIVAIECEQFWPQLFEHLGPPANENRRRFLLHSLSYWHADYLLARGIQPEREAYKQYKVRVETERRLRLSDPDLITKVDGSWATGKKGVIRAETADGKFHYVTQESYEALGQGLKLLSKCDAYIPKSKNKKQRD